MTESYKRNGKRQARDVKSKQMKANSVTPVSVHFLGGFLLLLLRRCFQPWPQCGSSTSWSGQTACLWPDSTAPRVVCWNQFCSKWRRQPFATPQVCAGTVKPGCLATSQASTLCVCGGWQAATWNSRGPGSSLRTSAPAVLLPGANVWRSRPVAGTQDGSPRPTATCGTITQSPTPYAPTVRDTAVLPGTRLPTRRSDLGTPRAPLRLASVSRLVSEIVS